MCPGALCNGTASPVRSKLLALDSRRDRAACNDLRLATARSITRLAHASLAQLAEQPALNRQVEGSTPSRCTTLRLWRNVRRGAQGHAGSSPAGRTRSL